MARRILIVAYHFFPDPAVGARRMSELAVSLRREGAELKVITAACEGDSALSTLPGLENVEVIRVPVPRKLYRYLRGKADGSPAAASHGSKAMPTDVAPGENWRRWLKRQYHALEWLVDDKKAWSLRALLAMRRLHRRFPFDAVISSGPPMSAHLAVLLGRVQSKFHWTMDLRDPWVDNAYWPATVRSGLRERLEIMLERCCMRRAHWVVAAAPGTARLLRENHPEWAFKVCVILNGYDGLPFDAPPAAPGALRFLFAGSLYFNRDPFPFLCALRRLLARPEVRREAVSFLMVGQCQRWGGIDIGQWVTEAGLDDCVRILPPVSPSAVGTYLNEANVLVNFAQGQPDQIPAKLYDYMVSGKESLVIAEPDSDVAKLTLESSTGRVVAPGDKAVMDQALSELYDFYVVRGQRFMPERGLLAPFSREVQNRRFSALLDAEASPHDRALPGGEDPQT